MGAIQTDLKIAIVHEWVASRAGSEKTFEALANCFPHADLYALTMEPTVELDVSRPVHTTILQRSAFLRGHRELTLPIMPLAWKAIRGREYDAVISSSHAFANYFPARTRHFFSYVHAPLRFAWTPEIDGRGAGRLKAPARSILRSLDRRSSSRVDHFAANSTETAERIRKFYDRAATVIFPPVDVERFSVGSQGTSREDFILGFSRWVPYKRLDLVIEVGERLDVPVVIAGQGPDRDRLRYLANRASVPVRIVEAPTDQEVADLYRTTRALVFPAVEDFGIVPLEAQACGTPVVGVDIAGSRDTIVDGETGALAADQSVGSLAEATKRALIMDSTTRSGPKNASRFSRLRFNDEISEWFRGALEDPAS